MSSFKKSMKSIWTIMHKELTRVFKSPSMLMALLLPGVFIFALYSIMGATTPETNEEAMANATYIVYVVNPSEEIQGHMEMLGFDVTFRELNTAAEALERKSSLEREDAHLILIFEEAFDYKFKSFESPYVRVFFNPHYRISFFAHDFMFTGALNAFQNEVIYEETDITISPLAMVDLGWWDGARGETTHVYDIRRIIGGALADFIPMMLIIFLFSGCMTITAEAVAGEKERGTIATLLATPAKRSHIAIGKVLALSILAMLSALSTFVGLMLSMPNLLNMSISDIYGFGEWALVLLILMSTVFLIVGAMSLISAFAKTIKESTMWISVLMFVGMGLSMLSMIIGIPTSVFVYLIPLYNSSLAIASVISFEVIVLNLVVTFVSNLVYSLLLVWGMAKVFNSEKIMFAK